MTFLLILTIAGVTTQHNVTAFNWTPGSATYVENGAQFDCSGVTAFGWQASTATVSAAACVPDKIFGGSFE